METNNNVEKTYTDPETGKFRTGNPGGGRPKGSISIKDKVRQHLEKHPEAVEEIVKHFVENNRELMWQMLEGRPAQGVEVSGELVNRTKLDDEQLSKLIQRGRENIDSSHTF